MEEAGRVLNRRTSHLITVTERAGATATGPASCASSLLFVALRRSMSPLVTARRRGLLA